jgi:hypothetical protein
MSAQSEAASDVIFSQYLDSLADTPVDFTPPVTRSNTPVPTHFVPTEEIQKLTVGSYEHLASKLDEALSRDAAKIFGDSIPNKIERIGTFAEHVLVAADDGRFLKVRYERATGGTIKLVGSEPLEVQLYNESNLGSYLEKEARTIVESLLAHDVPQAELKLRALVPFVEEAAPLTDEQVVASAVESMRAERPWKRLYRERAEQVKDFLGEQLKGIEARKLPPKFAKLSDGQVPEAQHEGYKELVHDDLVYMAEALKGWFQSLESIERLKAVDTANEEERAVKTTFLAFAEDLRQDIQNVRDSVLESLNLVGSVAQLGVLYDALVEEAFHYEVASCFASTMITELHGSK